MSFLELVARSEKETLKFRLLAILAVAVGMLLQARSVPLLETLILIIGYLVYSYVLRVYLIPRYLSYPLAAFIMLADVGTFLAALYILGLGTPVFALLPIAVVYHAIYLGYAGGLAMATLSTLGYIGLAFITGQSSELGERLAVQVPLFYVLAFLAGYVSQQRFSEAEERRSLQQLIGAETHARQLVDLTQSLSRAPDIEHLSRNIARMGALVARMKVCLIFLLDQESKGLLYHSSNVEQPGGGKNGARELQEYIASSFIGEAWRQGRLLTFSRQVGSPELVLPYLTSWFSKGQVARGLAVPIVLESGGMGVVCALDDEEAPLEIETVEGFKAFAEVAGDLLSRFQVYSEAGKRSSRVLANLQQSIDTTERIREQSAKRVLRFGSLTIDPTKETVRLQDTVLHLTRTEFDLMYALADKTGAVLNQEMLTRVVWGKDYLPQGKVVDVTVHRLRRKLSRFPEGQNLIANVRGQGYTFVPPKR